MSDALREIEAAIAEVKQKGIVGEVDHVEVKPEKNTDGHRNGTTRRDTKDKRRSRETRHKGRKSRDRSSTRKYERRERHRRSHRSRSRRHTSSHSKGRTSRHRSRHHSHGGRRRRTSNRRRKRSRSTSFDPKLAEVVRKRVAAKQQGLTGSSSVAGISPANAPAAMPAVNLATTDTRPYRELYVSGFPAGITTTALHEFLNGIIAMYGVVPNPNPVTRVSLSGDGAYAFIELRSIEETDICLVSLDGLPCMNSTLKVGRPKNYPGPPPVGLTAGVPSVTTGLLDAEAIAKQLEQTEATLGKPSQVIELLNTICDDDLSNPKDIQDVEEDIQTECGKYGRVLKVVLPKKGDKPLAVYVQFSNADEAFAAIEKLSGRTFDGRSISAKYFPLSEFEAKSKNTENAESNREASPDTSVAKETVQ